MSALDAELFRRILKNLKVKNYQEIARRRGEIAKALNREYRDLPTSMANVLMVGSYGRHTAINGISDLDLLYILPSELRNKYRSQDGPSKVLERTKKAIAAHYSTTRVSVSQLVVVVEFQDFAFEVQPVFRDKDGDFVYPDTRKKIWCYTKPGKEIDAIKIFNEETSGALRYLCRLMRAWKDKHDVYMGGLLIDTLAFNFLKEKEEYRSIDEPGLMIRDFLSGCRISLPRNIIWLRVVTNKLLSNRLFKGKRLPLTNSPVEHFVRKKWRKCRGAGMSCLVELFR